MTAPRRGGKGRRGKPRHLTHSIGAELNAAAEAKRLENAAKMRTVFAASVRADLMGADQLACDLWDADEYDAMRDVQALAERVAAIA